MQDFDALVCAEIPDPEKEPVLHGIVTTNNMHGPCGEDDPNCPCMKNGVCSCGYKKDWEDTTVLPDGMDNYIVMRRREDGRKVKKVVRARNGVGHKVIDGGLVPRSFFFPKLKCRQIMPNPIVVQA